MELSVKWNEGSPGVNEAGEDIVAELYDGEVVYGFVYHGWPEEGPPRLVNANHSIADVDDLSDIVRWRYLLDD